MQSKKYVDACVKVFWNLALSERKICFRTRFLLILDVCSICSLVCYLTLYVWLPHVAIRWLESVVNSQLVEFFIKHKIYLQFVWFIEAQILIIHCPGRYGLSIIDDMHQGCWWTVVQGISRHGKHLPAAEPVSAREGTSKIYSHKQKHLTSITDIVISNRYFSSFNMVWLYSAAVFFFRTLHVTCIWIYFCCKKYFISS